MGLHLNYELRLPDSTSSDDVGRTLHELRAFALTLPFRHVSHVYEPGPDARGEGLERLRWFAAIIAEPWPEDDPPLAGDVATAQGFFVNPGERCETACCGFLRRSDQRGRRREWFWHWSCKTQYASVVSDQHLVACHTSLVRLLDRAIALGVDVIVRDETHYWETREEQQLIANVHSMNRIIAGMAGRLSDAVSQDAQVQAPIFSHPRFERLEMDEET